jgi:1,4-alpha-glucan branching enzyme
MLSEADASALIEARHADPFSVLGLHADADGKLWIAAMLPGATSVDVMEADTGKRVVALQQRDATGLFVARIPRRKNRFRYRLAVTWHDGKGGNTGTYDDAYAFGPQIDDATLRALCRGDHAAPYDILGAHAITVDGVAGVLFAVWAPNARRVGVVGDFNAWDGRRHAMRLRHEAGVWEIFVPHVAIGDKYKFELVSQNGTLLPLKADPYARAAELRPESASIVAPMPAPRALPAARAQANARDAAISIYEVHLASWKRPDNRFPTWDELSATLPAYAADLGFTHIELLPISEHPFDGSWGYQTLGLFAPTARFGPPEAFVRFVDACHARGVGVLLDWVPAHFPSDAFGMAQFDGTALYEYADPREGFHRDWNTLIYNFGRDEVRSFLTGSACYWVERFGVDGLRVDAVASMLYRDYSRNAGEWIPNAHGGRENLEAISLFKHINGTIEAVRPGAMMVAEESTAFPGVTAPPANGLGFSFKWNMGWMNDTLAYMKEEPVHRRWHHNKMTFGLVYAFSEHFVLPISHDEVVHGKGSMLAKMPGDEWQRFANLRAYYGFMWGHPGKKLLFMGQEFAQPTEWNHDHPLPWHLLDETAHVGVQRLIRDLNSRYRELPALHQLDGDAAGFEWLVGDDADQSVFAWIRRSASPGAGRDAMVIVISNFTPVPREAYRLGVPEGVAAWKDVLNTDSGFYGGSNLGNGPHALAVTPVAAHGRAQSLTLTIPPLATLFLVPA